MTSFNPSNPLYDNIPVELKALKNWVYWRLEEKPNGDKTKVPKSPVGGYNASTTNPNTWASFETAVKMSVNGNGIGFVFTADTGYVGLDIDHNTDMDIVTWLDSYAERSQSGNGIHVIMKGVLPEYMGKKEGQGRRVGQYELYDRGRYFCMTGDMVLNRPIADCQDKLNEFIASVFTAPAPKAVDLSTFLKQAKCPQRGPDVMDEILQSAQATLFQDLWDGGLGRNPSQSEADMALLSILRWWTYGNQHEALTLFRQSPRFEQRKQKLERADYLLRTWEKLSGPVREDITALPVTIVKARSAAPWRKIDITHVQNALQGTILEPMVEAMRSPTLEPLPLEIALAKTLSLCGCALSGKAEKPRSLSDYIQIGNKLAKLRILTGGGSVSNFWTLTVGKTTSGKDIGGIMDEVAKQFKWAIGNAGSEEGIADAYVNNPVGLIAISEMQNWLDCRHWQSKASGFLTHAFNKGWFSHVLSKRSDNPNRETNYCYPNICAAVQPGVLQQYATKTHVESGFLGRFLIIQVPDFDVYPSCRDLTPEVHTCVSTLQRLCKLTGDVVVPDYYNRPLNEMFRAENAEPEAAWKRIAAEYYPRLALLLSLPADPFTGDSPVITDTGWSKAHVLAQYFFRQAEEVFATLHFDQDQSKFEGICERILSVIRDAPGRTLHKYEISQSTGRGTKAKDREEALKELVERGLVFATKSDTPKGGLKFTVV